MKPPIRITRFGTRRYASVYGRWGSSQACAELRKSKICPDGWGVFATRDLPAQCYVTYYEGKFVFFDEGEEEEDDYAFEIPPEFTNERQRGWQIIGTRDVHKLKGRGLAQMVNDAIHREVTGRNNNCDFVFRAVKNRTRRPTNLEPCEEDEDDYESGSHDGEGECEGECEGEGGTAISVTTHNTPTPTPKVRIYLQTVRPVKQGTELLAPYGIRYWLGRAGRFEQHHRKLGSWLTCHCRIDEILLQHGWEILDYAGTYNIMREADHRVWVGEARYQVGRSIPTSPSVVVSIDDDHQIATTPPLLLLILSCHDVNCAGSCVHDDPRWVTLVLESPVPSSGDSPHVTFRCDCCGYTHPIGYVA